MTKLSTSEAIGSLAANIGENIYMDVAKWHLYLSDAHLDTVLAEKLYPLISEKSIQEEQVLEILRNISVKLGGGKREVPLIDLLPMQCQVSLIDLVEEFQRNL